MTAEQAASPSAPRRAIVTRFWREAVVALVPAAPMAASSVFSLIPASARLADGASLAYLLLVFGALALALAYLAAIPVSLGCALVAWGRRRSVAPSLRFCAAFALGAILVIPATGVQDLASGVGRRRTMGQGQLVVRAIERYHHERKHYPESLGALIPEYLHDAPSPRVLCAVDFQYDPPGAGDTTAADRPKGAPPYDLYVRCGLFMPSQELRYWPHNVPFKGLTVDTTEVERIGDWVVLYHED